MNKRVDNLLNSAHSTFYTVEQICWKCREIQDIFTESKSKRPYRKIVCTMIDLTLGVFFCLCMRNLIDTKYLVTKLLIKREEARCSIMNLLQWLMGVPAGLKLNHELSAFMGNFFIYHVYIWIAYLNVLEPYLEAAINLLTLSSCASFSLYLSFLNDLINLASFHVYCFYAYAAKFYHLLLTGLISLFRLFMGK